jgi:hypothetical protein
MMKYLPAIVLGVLALATFTACESERAVTQTTTTEETSVHTAAPTTTQTQVTRSY